MGNDLIYKINSEVCPPDKFDHQIDVSIPANKLSGRLEEILTILKGIGGRTSEEMVCYIKRREDGKYNIHTYFPQI